MTNKNRIDHIGWAVQPENLDGYVEKLSSLFETTFEELSAFGAHMFVSWECGIELATPRGDGPGADNLRAFLEENGEGLFAIVFGAPDIDAATRRAGLLGWPTDTTVQGDERSAPLWTKVTECRERFVGPFMNTMLMFGEVSTTFSVGPFPGSES